MSPTVSSWLNLSAGSIETRESEVRVRTLGQRYDQQEFEDLVVLGRSDGTMVRLGDIAEVRDGFQETALTVRHEGQPAVFIEISRGQGEDVADVVATVKEHVENTVIPSLPKGIEITVWNDDSELFEERLNLLMVTTFLGFTPIFFERAIQAQFLVRFAASIEFGIIITTAILMLLVPALMAIHLRSRTRGDKHEAAAYAHPA